MRKSIRQKKIKQTNKPNRIATWSTVTNRRQMYFESTWSSSLMNFSPFLLPTQPAPSFFFPWQELYTYSVLRVLNCLRFDCPFVLSDWCQSLVINRSIKSTSICGSLRVQTNVVFGWCHGSHLKCHALILRHERLHSQMLRACAAHKWNCGVVG